VLAANNDATIISALRDKLRRALWLVFIGPHLFVLLMVGAAAIASPGSK
jgi:hypothetical protein